VAAQAAESGVTIGLENSLSPAHNKKLVDLVAHPGVKVYYDAYNMAYYDHAVEAVPGFKLLGTERICQVHVKNGEKLLEAEDGLIDWAAAFDALNDIGYDGWYVFESQHSDKGNVVEATNRNIDFMREHCRMPVA
jgi:sugar phosphate isomerase/epimerase